MTHPVNTRPLNTAALSDMMLHLDGDEPLSIGNGSCKGDSSLRGASMPETRTLQQALGGLPIREDWSGVTALQSVRLFAELLNHVDEEALTALCEETDMTREELDGQIGHCLELWEAIKLGLGLADRPTVHDLIIHCAEEQISGVQGTLNLPEDWRG